MHIYKTRIKVLLRTKSLIFWTLAFPIVLATFFNIAFSNLTTSEKFNPIKVGIVEDSNYKNLTNFVSLISDISKNDKNQILIATYYPNKDEANKVLKENLISGFYIVNDKIDIVVKSNGTSQTIMKYIVDNYYQSYSVVSNIIKLNKGVYKENMLASFNSNKSYFVSATVGKLDPTVLYFYSLIGMVCLYGGFFGVNAVNETEANLSKKAARLSVAPTNKFKNLILSLLAGYTIQMLEALILFIYLIFVLNINFGNHVFYVLLMLFIGSLAGISFGTLIGVSNKKNENMKIGLVLSISMACSFLSGLMIVQMKYIIEAHAPIIAKINPVSMITDGLYSLYYYENLNRYFYNIISLIIFTFIMIMLSFLFIRRKKYDSI